MCLKFLAHLNPQPTFYVFLENNSIDGSVYVIWDWLLYHSNSKLIRLWFRNDAVKALGNPYAVIGTVRQILLDYARKLDLDYAIFVDDDVYIVDYDFIPRITAWKKDLIGAPYLRKFLEGVFIASKWLNVDANRKIMPYRLKRSIKGLNDVYMTSAGCVCISRKLLDDHRVNFMPILSTEDTSEDFGFCIRARQAGYQVFLDGSLKTGHNIRNTGGKAWTVDPAGKYVDFQFPSESKT